MHTIKGSAAMMELDDVASFAHKIESECDFFRQGKAIMNEEMIKLSLKAHDHILKLIDAYCGEPAVDQEETNGLIEKFQKGRIAATIEDAQSQENNSQRAIELTGELSALLEKLKKNPKQPDLLDKISHSVSLLYFMSLKINKESVAEFLSEFETTFRKARTTKEALPEEVAPLAKEVFSEAKSMLEDKPMDEDTDIDPAALMLALQRPLELRARMNSVLDKVKISDVALPPKNHFKIEILSEGEDGVSSHAKVRLVNLLKRLGEVTSIKDKGPDTTAQEILNSFFAKGETNND
jgi:chemotaxis protein histidine kinase CheA